MNCPSEWLRQHHALAYFWSTHVALHLPAWGDYWISAPTLEECVELARKREAAGC